MLMPEAETDAAAPAALDAPAPALPALRKYNKGLETKHYS